VVIPFSTSLAAIPPTGEPSSVIHLGRWRIHYDPFTAVAFEVAIILIAIPRVRRWLGSSLAWVGGRRGWTLFLLIFGLSLGEFARAAVMGNYYLEPKYHDEHSYRLSALMLASGKLWAPAPPAPDSVESFHIITRPVYASIYPPGTGLIHAVPILLGFPDWWLCAALAALAVATGFLVLRGAFGGEVGLIGALLLLGAPQLRAQSTIEMSHVPSLLLGELTVLALWWWLGKPSVWRALVLGLPAGLHVITRPQDAACVLLPSLMFTLAVLRRSPGAWAGSGAAAVLVVLGFASLSVVQNVGTTGSALRTPYWAYTQAMQPGTGFLTPGPETRPATSLRQKIDLNETFGREARKQWYARDYLSIANERLLAVVRGGLPMAAFGFVVPLGACACLARSRGRMLLATGACFAAVYGTFTFFLPHYVLPFEFVLVALVAASPLALPGARARGAGTVGLAVVSLAALVARLPHVNPTATDFQAYSGELQKADEVERSLTTRPAILLFRYTPSPFQPFQQEPVYNLKSWDIDAHAVIRAHDLGPELNRKLFEAYAGRGPRRYVYRFDRATETLTPMGWADELAVR
jgi:hypothetical protein